jgi:hypothetical protein
MDLQTLKLELLERIAIRADELSVHAPQEFCGPQA